MNEPESNPVDETPQPQPEAEVPESTEELGEAIDDEDEDEG